MMETYRQQLQLFMHLQSLLHLMSHELNRSTDDEFIIIATDGIWDVMNGSQAVTFVRSKLKSDPMLSMTEVADALLSGDALRNRTQDNIACIVIDLRVI